MEDNEQKVSKYSSGVNINLRLDQLWKDSHKFVLQGMFYQWNLVLDNIWSELARDLKDKTEDDSNSFTEVEKRFEKFDEKLIKAGQINDSGVSGFGKSNEEENRKRGKHYKILREKQIFLARLENKLGKGTTYEEDDEDDMN